MGIKDLLATVKPALKET
jgi:exonuclease-1